MTGGKLPLVFTTLHSNLQRQVHRCALTADRRLCKDRTQGDSGHPLLSSARSLLEERRGYHVGKLTKSRVRGSHRSRPPFDKGFFFGGANLSGGAAAKFDTPSPVRYLRRGAIEYNLTVTDFNQYTPITPPREFISNASVSPYADE